MTSKGSVSFVKGKGGVTHAQCVSSLFFFLVEVSISDSQKLIEWMYREVEEYSRPEKHYEPIWHN